VAAKQGEYGSYEYGARYQRDVDGKPYFGYSSPSGASFEFSVPAFRSFLEEVKRPVNGVVPTKFKVTESGNAPWYTRPEVNVDRLDDLATKWADRNGGTGEGARTVREVEPREAVPYRAGPGPGNPRDAAGFASPPEVARAARSLDVSGDAQFSPRQTDTPEFKKFFRASKVVDENGKPLVVYHGTNSDFSTFLRSMLGSMSGAASAARAFFFTNDPGVAGSYAAGINVYDEGALWLTRFGQWVMGKENYVKGNEWLLKQLGMGSGITHGENIMPVYLSIQNPMVVEFNGQIYRETSFNDLIARAERLGHDGLIFRNVIDPGYADTAASENVSDIYAVFRPEQIKSATGNRGTFDPNNPDIRYSPRQIDTPEFKKFFRASKVVDADGKPLPLYHGTADSLDSFDLDHPNRKDTGWLGTGVYLTTDRTLAGSYSNLKRGSAAPYTRPLGNFR